MAMNRIADAFRRITASPSAAGTAERRKEKYLTAKDLRANYTLEKRLSGGADGNLAIWKNAGSGHCVVVKTDKPHEKFVLREINFLSMKHLRNNDWIVRMVGNSLDDRSVPPSMYMELSDIGDAIHLSDKLKAKYGFVPEQTIWKFFSDVAQGLDFLHNRAGVRVMHLDIKPENTLVFRRPGDPDEIPVIPSFKITDFGRADYVEYPTFDMPGTPEYCPPERRASPAADIWALGGCLQMLAYHLVPVATPETWVAQFVRNNRRLPPGTPVGNPYDHFWRFKIPPKFRPLNRLRWQQMQEFGLPFEYTRPKSSDKLNHWYARCMEPSLRKRVTASELARGMVADAQVEMVRLEAARLRAQIAKPNSRAPSPLGILEDENEVDCAQSIASSRFDTYPRDSAVLQELPRVFDPSTPVNDEMMVTNSPLVQFPTAVYDRVGLGEVFPAQMQEPASRQVTARAAHPLPPLPNRNQGRNLIR